MSVKVLLDDQISQLFNENKELLDVNANQFEIATASFCNLKFLNGLDQDDLIDGILGAGGDEGIDLCYTFCNGFVIGDDSEPTITKDSSIKFKFFQVKKENGFSTDGFRKMAEGISQIFDLSLETHSIKKKWCK